MKAKLKDGRILPIENGSVIALDNNGETVEVYVEEIDSFINDSVDWGKRRYEITEDILAAFMSNSNPNVYGGLPEKKAKEAVIYADALIEELKKQSDESENKVNE